MREHDIQIIDGDTGNFQSFVIVKIPARYLKMIGCATAEYNQYIIDEQDKVRESLEKLFNTHTKALRICQNEHLAVKTLDNTLEKLRNIVKERSAYIEEHVVTTIGETKK